MGELKNDISQNFKKNDILKRRRQKPKYIHYNKVTKSVHEFKNYHYNLKGDRQEANMLDKARFKPDTRQDYDNFNINSVNFNSSRRDKAKTNLHVINQMTFGKN